MNKFMVYPYRLSSVSSKSLADGLDCKRILHPSQGSTFRGGPSYTVINWGNSIITHSGVLNSCILNKAQAVYTAVNKNLCLAALGDYAVPYTTNKDMAREWFATLHKVVCRLELTAHSGRGIIVASTPEELVDAPLYTLYISNRREYRVHVMNNEVIDMTRKGMAADRAHDPHVWNHANGYIFMRGNLDDAPYDELYEVKSVGLYAVAKLGLDFGAVDIAYDLTTNHPYVLEVNTAPGLKGPTTLAAYVDGFKRHYNSTLPTVGAKYNA